MKTTLPERSLVIKERLDRIIEEIIACQKDKIAMIILFGSYARGNWVRDEYVKDHVTYTYQSDLDLLLILRKGKYAGIGLEGKIKKKLERKSILNPFSSEPWLTMVLEPIAKVNKLLQQGQYFFSDIKKEGVLLYDNGEFELSEAKELSLEERRKIAQKDYDYWFKSGSEFLIDSNNAFARGNNNFSAFYLHQATESFYSAILLVFSGYKPKLHDIEKLGRMVSNYSSDLLKIFPTGAPEQTRCFELLKNAYIEARYDENYCISEEQLKYLVERVEELKIVTQKICLKQIASYKK